MLRSLLFALAALLAAPVFAQDAPTDSTMMPPDAMADSTMMADSAAVVVVEPSPEKARELYAEGNEVLRTDPARALEKYDEALLYNEAYAVAALGRAQALVGLRQMEEATAAYESAITLAQAAGDGRVVTRAREQLAQINESMAQRAAQQADAEATAAAVRRASDLLQTDPVSVAQANEALQLLQQAEAGGMEASGLAFYYAKAYNALDRGAEAVPYAQAALDASTGDQSAFYIQLGLAHKSAGDTDAARAAFESAKEGSWAGWADHYLRELDAPSEEG